MSKSSLQNPLRNLRKRVLGGYLCFAAVIFAGTALAKLLSDFSDPDLRGADPFVRFISAKHLMLLVPGIVLLWLMRGNRNAKAKIGLLVLGFFIAGLSKAIAQDLTFEPLFTAQGVDKREIIDMQGNAGKLDPIFFEISKDADGNWQSNIRSYMSNDDMTSWMHNSCDGTNVYSTVHTTKIMMLDWSHEPVQNVFTGAEHSAEIRPGTPSNIYCGTLWVTFFGGEYLMKHPDARIPLYINRYDPIPWAYDFEYEWHENAKVPLLQSGKFRLNPDLLFDDMIHYPEVSEPSEEQLQRMLSDIKWHRKFAKHAQKENPELLMLSSFQVEEIVSGANFSFPKKVTWERYNINLTNLTTRYLSLKGVLEVTNWIVHPKGKRIPLLPKLTGTNVGFQDFRFQFRDDRKYFNQRWYELSDGIWPISTNDSRIAKSSKMIFEPRTRLGKRNFMYYLNVTLAIILFSLPAIFWFQKQRSKR